MSGNAPPHSQYLAGQQSITCLGVDFTLQLLLLEYKCCSMLLKHMGTATGANIVHDIVHKPPGRHAFVMPILAMQSYMPAVSLHAALYISLMMYGSK